MPEINRYTRIIERIFASRHQTGANQVDFARDEIETVAAELGIRLPRNLGDLIYSFRYRVELPESIRSRAPRGKQWIIVPAGRGRYRFQAVISTTIIPREDLAQTKILDATPGMIEKYALSDEQALLAKLRYNRLIDVFSGVACYSLQSHLRTTVEGMGQVETDEVYVGLDKRGAHFVFPVQAKGGRDRISVVQIMQDFAMCRERFTGLLCRPIAAQFMAGGVIALFELEEFRGEVRVCVERHYRLVPKDELTDDEIQRYRTSPGE